MAYNVPKVELKENVYADVILPLVSAFNPIRSNTRSNAARSQAPNPHEVWLAASLIKLRGEYWGENLPDSTDEADRFEPLETPAQYINAAVRGAQADGPGAANPNTTRIQTLEKQLRGMAMNQPNAWQDWSEAVNFFYKSVGPFTLYFEKNYKAGAYSDFYRNNLGLFDHPDGSRTGLFFDQGSLGSVSESAFFDIDFADAVAAELQNRFFIIPATDGTTNLLWYNVSGGGVAPTVPVDTVVAIAISSADDIAAIITATKTALDSLTAMGSSVLTTTVVGTVIECVYDTMATVTPVDEGTAQIGVNYDYSDELRGSDASVLATGITDKEDYANKWNTIKVPYEATLGNTYPYLNPCVRGVNDPGGTQRVGDPCPNNCGLYQTEVGCAVYCAGGNLACCKGCAKCVSSSSTSFLATAYISFNIPNYNTPGNIFIARDGRQANLTRIEDVV